MALETEKSLKVLFVPALLSVSLLTIMSSTAVSPILGLIGQSFPNASDVEVKMVMTLPAVISLMFSQICGWMSIRKSKRSILLAGIALYTAGGCGGAFANNIYILIFMRMIMGAGLGLIQPLSTGLIADNFKGEKCTGLIGFSQVLAQVGSMAGTLLSGLIADYNWRFAFFIYGIGVPIFILVYLAIPNTYSNRKSSEKALCIGGKFSMGIFRFAIIAFIFSLIFTNITANISVYVKDMGLLTKYAGIGICVMALGGLMGSACLIYTMHILHQMILPGMMAVIAVGFFFLSRAVSLSHLLFSLYILGFSGGTFSTSLFALFAKQAVGEQNTLGMAFINAGNAIGSFFCPFSFVVTARILNSNSLSQGFEVNAAESLLIAIILFASSAFKSFSKFQIGHSMK